MVATSDLRTQVVQVQNCQVSRRRGQEIPWNTGRTSSLLNDGPCFGTIPRRQTCSSNADRLLIEMKSTAGSNPSACRQPSMTDGFFKHYVVHPFLGFLFDVSGGVFRVDGCSFSVPKGMTTIGWRGACCWKGSYEADERALIKRFVRAEDTVIEVGACLGVVSCVTNQLLRDRSKHLVVEANPFLIPSLCRNRERNGAGFLIEHCAIGTPPEVTFHVHPTVIVEGSAQKQVGRGYRLPSRSLRELHERYGPFNTLIMDVEGSEFVVLQAAQDLLVKYRLVVVEFHGWIVGEDKITRCREILAESGLRRAAAAGFTEAWVRE